jgi:hypothetical protein
MRRPFYCLLIVWLVIPNQVLLGQSVFSGRLLNKVDSMPVGAARVLLTDINTSVLTQEDGTFRFTLPEKLETLHFRVDAIGLKTSIVLQPKGKGVEDMYVDMDALGLEAFSVRGYSPRQVIGKAVKEIRANLPDSGYVIYSFFRQYQKVNDRFKNFIEAKPVVMIKPGEKQAEIAYAVPEMRRSYFRFDVDDMFGDALEYTMQISPVYRPDYSSVSTSALRKCRYRFDTSSGSDDYVIRYDCHNFSAEGHGNPEYAQAGFEGESDESGTVIIERESFAIKSLERKSIRNMDYHYHRNNNFLLPSRKYTVEFLEGSFKAEFRKLNGKWYPWMLVNQFTNEYYRTQTYTKTYVITETSEWYVDTVSRYIPGELRDKFYKQTNLTRSWYTYDPGQWKERPGFYFDSGANVLKEIEKYTPADRQFAEEGVKEF